MAVVFVDAVLRRAMLAQSALDIVFRVAVNQADVRIETVLAESAVVAEIEIEVVASFGPQVGAPRFEVLVAEQLVGGRQPERPFVGAFGLQRFQDVVRPGRTAAPCRDASAQLHVVAHAVGAARNGPPVVLQVIFDECRGVPPLRRNHPVGEPADVLAREFGNREIREHRRGADVRTARAAEIAEDMVECQRVDFADAVVERQRGVPVRVARFAVLIGLFAAAILFVVMAVPVVVAGRGVDVVRDVAVVIGRHEQVEPFGEKVALGILQRRGERMALAVLPAEDDFLIDAGLDLLVKIGIGEAQHEAVRPFFAGQTEFAEHDLVVESVVEAPDVLHVALVHGKLVNRTVGQHLEFAHPVVDVIVIVGIVLESVDFVQEAASGRLPETEVRAVGVERTVGVGGVGEPVAPLFVRHDVDDAADGVGAETDRHHPLVDFDALGEACRNVVQVERLPGSFLGHAVDEDLDVLAAEPVEHQLHVGAYAARFAEFHAGQFREGVAQALGRVLQGFRIDRHRVERRLLHAAYAAARDNDLFEFGRCRLQDDREVFHVLAGLYVFLCGFVADDRHGQRMLSGRHFETEKPLIVRSAAVVRAFQTDGGESDGRAVFLHHLSREPCGGVRAVMSGMRTMGLGGCRLKADDPYRG